MRRSRYVRHHHDQDDRDVLLMDDERMDQAKGVRRAQVGRQAITALRRRFVIGDDHRPLVQRTGRRLDPERRPPTRG